MRHIALVVLNYNRADDTIHCIKSILRLDPDLHFDYSIWLVDNGSPNDSKDRILQWMEQSFSSRDFVVLGPKSVPPRNLPRLLFLANSENKGYAGGNNAAIRLILKHIVVDYIWILNNDTEVAPNSLSKLYLTAQRCPEITIWGSTILEFDRRDIIQAAGGAKYYPWLATGREFLRGRKLAELKGQLSHQPHLDYISGASMFIRSDIFDEIGLLSEDYFLYFEEIDLAFRGRKKGYLLGWSPESRVYHKEGAVLGSNRNIHKKSILSEYYGNHSALLFTHKFYPLLFWPIAILRFTLKSAIFFMRGQFRLLPPLYWAYRDFWGNKKNGTIVSAKTPLP